MASAAALGLMLAVTGPLQMGVAAAATPSTEQLPTYPIHKGWLEKISGSLRPGRMVTFAGGGFGPGSSVRVTVESNSIYLGTFKANAAGHVEFTVTLPDSLEPGTHRLIARGGGAVAVLEFEVIGKARLAGEGLPLTGAPIAATVALGGLVLVSGAVAVSAARRRQH